MTEGRHDEDGKPYLAYYRNDLTIGFVWSGKSGDEVQVTREMSEPIIATFPVTLTTWPTPDLFKDVCEKWIEEYVGDDGPLDVTRKMELIEKSGWPLAWDGCHKIYFLQDEGRERMARETGYVIFPSTELHDLWESSCGLRFVSRWGYDNDDFDHPWNIQQFEED